MSTEIKTFKKISFSLNEKILPISWTGDFLRLHLFKMIKKNELNENAFSGMLFQTNMRGIVFWSMFFTHVETIIVVSDAL